MTRLYGDETGAQVRVNPNGIVKTRGLFARALPIMHSKDCRANCAGSACPTRKSPPG